jgi:cbb3-type cytochrome oxidase cytochrome c subunit
LIDFIEWQERVKRRKVQDKERESKKAEYEKRDQEREKEEKLRQYLGEIELINQLITYLNNLKSDNQKSE